jgi:protein-S-isoprenylcysteine O-methyltransferase Ste14
MFYHSFTFRKKNIDALGEYPINKILFKLGKLAMLVSWIFLILYVFEKDFGLVSFGAIQLWLARVVMLLAIFVITGSVYYLGYNNRFGLPKEDTVLKNYGIYKFSRNPMYVGFFLLSISSCIYVINPLNIVATVFTIFVHHKIVLSEEKFLKGRFAEDYESYCTKVKRYI